MIKFSIVIPNYNSEKWIVTLLDSIKNQTFKEFEVIIVDDLSEDSSVDKIKKYEGLDVKLIELNEKRYNGGTRNEGVKNAQGKYIIFADCDDWFYSNNCLEEISKIIDVNNNPDLIRLPYHYLVKHGEGDVSLHEKSLEELTKTVFVAPWTKCIKRELFVPFPENTLIEDVSQHIQQMDKIKTVAYCDIPVIVWNCRNEDSISHEGNEEKSVKRMASYWRIIADLMDLEGKLQHNYCEEHRKLRLNNYLNMAKERLR